MIAHRPSRGGRAPSHAIPVTSTAPRPEAPEEAPRLLLHDLLNDLAALAPMLLRELREGSRLNAYLLAAGIEQIAADHLHRDVWRTRELIGYIERRGRAGAWAAARARLARSGALALRGRDPQERRLDAWHARLEALVQRLALDLLTEPPEAHGRLAVADVETLGRAIELFARLELLPEAVRRSVVTLPTCFRSLDSRPEDSERLARSFAARRPDRARHLVVVGLRTSGSYLAPLLAAAFARLGYRAVEAMTLRPGQDWSPRALARVREALRGDALFILTDDPPNTGSSVLRAAAQVERLGVPAASVVLALPLFGREPPAVLRRYEAVLLPSEEWAVQQQLAAPRVATALAELLPGRAITVRTSRGPERVTVAAVENVERCELAPMRDLKAGSSLRQHVRALYRVRLRVRELAGSLEHDVYVKGVGLGYLGDHALAVSRPLARFFPEVYGVRDGLLFREWLPAARRVSLERAPRPDLARAVASYVAERGRALRVADDPTLRLEGEHPVWQRAADEIWRAFYRARPIVRPLTHRIAKQLLRVELPSVIDGSMSPSQWFAEDDGRAGAEVALRKVSFEERAFSNQDTVVDQLFCYDPIFDLASAAVEHEIETDGGDAGFEEDLRAAFERASGGRVSEERWLLYQWVLGTSLAFFIRVTLGAGSAREGLDQDSLDATVARSFAVRRALATFHQRFYGRRLLGDGAVAAAGPLCALDIDGVLESARLGFPATTPRGALALRALARHGFRVVLASARSLREVRGRCIAYRLAGGVAEHGTVTYARGRIRELVTPEERRELARVRGALRRIERVHLDDGYAVVVRAVRLAADGETHALGLELASLALERAGARRLRVVEGAFDTHFLPRGADKAAGVVALAEDLAGEDGSCPAEHTLLALAVGDGASDLPVLRLAERAFAPRNAAPELREAGIATLPGAYQVGLAQAVAALVGHRPGGCRACAPPEVSREAGLLLSALSAQDAGRWGKLVVALDAFRRSAVS